MNSQNSTYVASPAVLAADRNALAEAQAHLRFCGVGYRTLPGGRMAAEIVRLAEMAKRTEVETFHARLRHVAELQAATKVARPGSRRAKGKFARAEARANYGKGRVAA